MTLHPDEACGPGEVGLFPMSEDPKWEDYLVNQVCLIQEILLAGVSSPKSRAGEMHVSLYSASHCGFLGLPAAVCSERSHLG